MKKTDIAMILLIAVGSITIAFFVTQYFLGDTNEETVKVKVIEKIESNVTAPDSAIFNKDAINPTVEVTIDGTNQ